MNSEQHMDSVNTLKEHNEVRLTVWLLQGYDDPYLAPFTMLVEDSLEKLVAAAEGLPGRIQLIQNDENHEFPYTILHEQDKQRDYYQITKTTLGEWI